jgi:hypothetical protein
MLVTSVAVCADTVSLSLQMKTSLHSATSVPLVLAAATGYKNADPVASVDEYNVLAANPPLPAVATLTEQVVAAGVTTICSPLI